MASGNKDKVEGIGGGQKGALDKQGGGEGDGGELGITPMEASNWKIVVELVHTTFGEGRLGEEATWQAVVLIPNEGKDYCGVDLVEVTWKVVLEIFISGSLSLSPFTNSSTYFRRVAAQVLPPLRPSCFSS